MEISLTGAARLIPGRCARPAKLWGMTLSDSRAEHLPQLAQIIEEASGIDAGSIVPEAKISELGIDSLSLIEIAVRTEDAFGVRLEDETVLGFITVGDMLDLISAEAAG